MDNNDLDKIRSLDLQNVIEFYGIHFNSHGAARCPFHSERTASFKIHNGHYNCFGCGAYGDALDFVQRYFGLDFPSAIRKLNYDFNLEITGHRPTRRERLQAAEERRIDASIKNGKKQLRTYYRALSTVHRELWRRICEGIATPCEKETQKSLEGWLDDNIGEVVTEWRT